MLHYTETLQATQTATSYSKRSITPVLLRARTRFLAGSSWSWRTPGLPTRGLRSLRERGLFDFPSAGSVTEPMWSSVLFCLMRYNGDRSFSHDCGLRAHMQVVWPLPLVKKPPRLNSQTARTCIVRHALDVSRHQESSVGNLAACSPKQPRLQPAKSIKLRLLLAAHTAQHSIVKSSVPRTAMHDCRKMERKGCRALVECYWTSVVCSSCYARLRLRGMCSKSP